MKVVKMHGDPPEKPNESLPTCLAHPPLDPDNWINGLGQICGPFSWVPMGSQVSTSGKEDLSGPTRLMNV